MAPCYHRALHLRPLDPRKMNIRHPIRARIAAATTAGERGGYNGHTKEGEGGVTHHIFVTRKVFSTVAAIDRIVTLAMLRSPDRAVLLAPECSPASDRVTYCPVTSYENRNMKYRYFRISRSSDIDIFEY